MSIKIVEIKGNWTGGHNGKYPIVLGIDTSHIHKPFMSSQGFGWGLSGANFSVETLYSSELLEMYNLDESQWVYKILKKSFEDGLNQEEVIKLLIENKQE